MNETTLQTHVILKTAQPHELDGVVGLCKACVADMLAHGIDQWDEIYPDRPTFERDIRLGEMTVASINGEIVGCIVLNTEQDPEYDEVAWRYRPERVAVIHRLMVRPDYQGKGVARLLIEHAEEAARAQGFLAVRLDAFSQNPVAVPMYQKRGYGICGTITLRKGIFYCLDKAL